MDTTVFTTPALRKPAPEQRCGRAILLWLVGLVLTWGVCFVGIAGVQPEWSRVDRTEESIDVHARLSLTLTEPVSQALLKGVPIFFVWQADVFRDRWYWRDKRVTSAYRTWRLAYQPLTRRWRLSLSHQAPGNTQQFSLHQNLQSLDEALSAMGRINRWAVAPASSVSATEEHRVELSFRLDPALLPRPFQIGVASSPDWNIRWDQPIPVPKHISVDIPSTENSTPAEPAAVAVEP